MIKSFSFFIGAYLNFLSYVAPKKAASQGLKLFCFPFRSPLQKHHLKFFDTAETFSFDHDGIQIQGYRWGNGSKKILFLHGWQSHTFRWKKYIEHLSKDEYSIYAIDAPGHGLSKGSFLSVPYYSAVIQQLMGTLGPVYAMVTHSLGGFAALHAFTVQPTLSVSKLILTAPPGEASDFMTFYKNTVGLSDKTMNLILAHFEKTFKQPITYFSTPVFAKTLTVPGYIIHDEDDAETPYHYAGKIHANWKNSVLITTKGLGHNLRSKDIVAQVAKLISEPWQSPVMEIIQI